LNINNKILHIKRRPAKQSKQRCFVRETQAAAVERTKTFCLMYAQHLCVASLKAIRESLLQSGYINLKCAPPISRSVVVCLCPFVFWHVCTPSWPKVLRSWRCQMLMQSNWNLIQFEWEWDRTATATLNSIMHVVWKIRWGAYWYYGIGIQRIWSGLILQLNYQNIALQIAFFSKFYKS